MQRRRLDGPLHAEAFGEGPRLVFVHGFTQTGRSWLPIAERFADRFEVVVVDAPGHGDSSEIRADLPRTADLLAATTGCASYVGYSMGGRMVLHLAVTHPDLVERLVLVSTTAGIDDADDREARRRSDDALAADLERDGLEVFLDRWLALPLFAGLSRDVADHDDRRRNTVEGLASSLRLAGTGTQIPLWERLWSVNSPTLVITGENDAKFTELGRRLRASIGDASHLVIADAGHAVHLERPAEVAEAIANFVVSA
jgi:2-succinyl-6-hydroxy-2,4-cyclohexadiene-1-carboxylate synthase